MPDAAPCQSLAELEARLAYDLACLNHPPAEWLPRATGSPDLDALVVGGGMCGLTAAFALQRRGFRRLRIIDRCPQGREGPWVTYARMRTLRSPKHLSGPSLGLGPLTFRAWFEAQWGREAWDRLDRIPRVQWMDYLVWYRRVLGLEVENGVEATAVEPVGDGLTVTLSGPAGTQRVTTRRLILATGREGLAVRRVPGWAAALPQERWSHTADAIDFAALRGRRVAVLGYGASAFDNAAEALEAGAASVRLLARRSELPRVNKAKQIVYPGFTLGFPTLADSDRWRLFTYLFDHRVPPPRAAVLRVADDPRFVFQPGAEVTGAAEAADGVRLATGAGPVHADHVILGTGFQIDLAGSPLLAPVADRIAVWRDLIEPPAHQAGHEFLSFPALGPAFELRARTADGPSWLDRVHVFTFAAALSHGNVSGDIPAVSDGADLLADGVTASEFRACLPAMETAMHAFDDPELLGDEIARLARPPVRAAGS